jgi:nicotinate-nucleotide adenylyltransferase
MQFLHRAKGRPARVGIFPGAFNPPTVAHLSLARAALAHVDEAVFVLPRALPHKPYEGASLDERAQMLIAAATPHPALSVAIAEGGLFRAIAVEFRGEYGPGTRFSFLCGRDAAERVLNWDYGENSATIVAQMLREFDLLVAARRGEIAPPLHASHAIERLQLPENFDWVSSTDVRELIARGEPWEHMVPEAARSIAAAVYRGSNP